MKKLERGAGGGKAGLEDIPLKVVAASILPDNGAVFLFDETVVVFPVVPGAGERDGVGRAYALI
jgi:hypothetical protein